MFEDSRLGLSWTVNEEFGAVAFSHVQAGSLSWSASATEPLNMGSRNVLVVVPRALPTLNDHKLVCDLQTEYPNAVVALLVPIDMAETIPFACSMSNLPGASRSVGRRDRGPAT